MPKYLNTEYFNMDGYAAYVWSAYGIALVIILLMIGSSLWKRKKTRQEEQKLS